MQNVVPIDASIDVSIVASIDASIAASIAALIAASIDALMNILIVIIFSLCAKKMAMLSLPYFYLVIGTIVEIKRFFTYFHHVKKSLFLHKTKKPVN